MTLLQEPKQQNVENGFAPAAGKSEELEAVEHLISNHRELLRQVTSYPNRKLRQPDFLPYDTTDSLADPLPFPEPCHSLSSSASWKSGPRLKPLHELCNSYFLSLMKEQLADTERRLRGDRSVLRSARIARALSKRFSLLNFLFELCPEDGGEAESTQVETGRWSATALQSDPLSLESFLSCVEEIPIKLDAGEAGKLSPAHHVAMEMAGSTSSGDSIEVLGTEKSYRLQQAAAAAATPPCRGSRVAEEEPGSSRGDSGPLLSSPETPAGTPDAAHRRAAADGGIRHVRVSTRRENSEDSIEVLSTTDSIFPDDLAAITEEEAEQRLQSSGEEEEGKEEGLGVDGERRPDAAERGSRHQNDPPDAREPAGAAPANGDVAKGEAEVTCVTSSQAEEDKAARASHRWRGSVLNRPFWVGRRRSRTVRCCRRP